MQNQKPEAREATAVAIQRAQTFGALVVRLAGMLESEPGYSKVRSADVQSTMTKFEAANAALDVAVSQIPEQDNPGYQEAISQCKTATKERLKQAMYFHAHFKTLVDVVAENNAGHGSQGVASLSVGRGINLAGRFLQRNATITKSPKHEEVCSIIHDIWIQTLYALGATSGFADTNVFIRLVLETLVKKITEVYETTGKRIEHEDAATCLCHMFKFLREGDYLFDEITPTDSKSKKHDIKLLGGLQASERASGKSDTRQTAALTKKLKLYSEQNSQDNTLSDVDVDRVAEATLNAEEASEAKQVAKHANTPPPPNPSMPGFIPHGYPMQPGSEHIQGFDPYGYPIHPGAGGFLHPSQYSFPVHPAHGVGGGGGGAAGGLGAGGPNSARAKARALSTGRVRPNLAQFAPPHFAHPQAGHQQFTPPQYPHQSPYAPPPHAQFAQSSYPAQQPGLHQTMHQWNATGRGRGRGRGR
jgi:hypothetical protein